MNGRERDPSVGSVAWWGVVVLGVLAFLVFLALLGALANEVPS